MIVKTLKFSIIGVVLAALMALQMPINAMQQPALAVQNQDVIEPLTLSPSTLKEFLACTAKLFSFYGVLLPILTVVHESGHFFAIKLLDPSNTPIMHLGIECRSIHENKFPQIDLGSVKIYSLSAGGCVRMLPELNPMNRIIISAAGPITELFGMYAFFVIKTCLQNYRETKNLKQSLCFSVPKNFSLKQYLSNIKDLPPLQYATKFLLTIMLTSHIAAKLAYLLTPILPSSDGEDIWSTFIAFCLGYNRGVCSMGSILEKCTTETTNIIECFSSIYKIPCDAERIHYAQELLHLNPCNHEKMISDIATIIVPAKLISFACLCLAILIVGFKTGKLLISIKNKEKLA